jgi:hypothetical protein
MLRKPRVENTELRKEAEHGKKSTWTDPFPRAPTRIRPLDLAFRSYLLGEKLVGEDGGRINR